MQNGERGVCEEQAVHQQAKRRCYSHSCQDTVGLRSTIRCTHAVKWPGTIMALPLQDRALLMWHMYLPQALMLIDLIPTVVMFGGHMMVGGSWGGCADGMNVPPGLQQQGRGGYG